MTLLGREQSAGAAVVYANRSPALRAVVGTTRESLEFAMQRICPNVLIIEHPRQGFQELRNMLSLFIRDRPHISGEVQQQLCEMTGM